MLRSPTFLAAMLVLGVAGLLTIPAGPAWAPEPRHPVLKNDINANTDAAIAAHDDSIKKSDFRYPAGP